MHSLHDKKKEYEYIYFVCKVEMQLTHLPFSFVRSFLLYDDVVEIIQTEGNTIIPFPSDNGKQWIQIDATYKCTAHSNWKIENGQKEKKKLGKKKSFDRFDECLWCEHQLPWNFSMRNVSFWIFIIFESFRAIFMCSHYEVLCATILMSKILQLDFFFHQLCSLSVYCADFMDDERLFVPFSHSRIQIHIWLWVLFIHVSVATNLFI